MIKVKFKRFLIALLILFQQNNLSFAQDPLLFIENVTERASKILIKDLDKSQKSELLIELAEESVDIKGIGLYTLGKYRKKINNEERKEYEKLFRKYFLKSFSSRLSEYSDPKINVISKEIMNKNYTIVSSVLVGDDKRPEIKIDWRVYTKNPDNPLIRDLIIEGLSLARTQKEEFSSILNSNNNDINILISKLEEFINS